MAAAGIPEARNDFTSIIVSTIQGITNQRTTCLERVNGKFFSSLNKAALYSNDYFSALLSMGNTPAALKQIQLFKNKQLMDLGRLPPKFWTNSSDATKGKLHFQIKQGMLPTDGLDSIYNSDHPEKMDLSLIDCVTPCHFSYYKQILGGLGPEKFNALFAAESSTPLTFTRNTPSVLDVFLRWKKQTSAPKKGDMVKVAGISFYDRKHHITGHAGAYFGICTDDRPEQIKITAFGLPASGSTVDEIKNKLLADYNEPPLDPREVFDESSAQVVENSQKKLILSSIPDPMLQLLNEQEKNQYLLAAKAEMAKPLTPDRIKDSEWGKLTTYYSLDEEKIKLLARLSIADARKQLDKWLLQQKSTP